MKKRLSMEEAANLWLARFGNEWIESTSLLPIIDARGTDVDQFWWDLRRRLREADYFEYRISDGPNVDPNETGFINPRTMMRLRPPEKWR